MFEPLELIMVITMEQLYVIEGIFYVLNFLFFIAPFLRH